MGGRSAVLLTGATGTLGNLIATTLLRDTDVDVVAPIRDHHAPDAVAAGVARELALATGPVDPAWQRRLHVVPLPKDASDPDARDPLAALDPVARHRGIDEVIHCAGCLSYFDESALRAINIGLTERFVGVAKRWGVRRFVYVSSAFASGFRDGPIPERLHDAPAGDPTFYTESKRRAEQVVADAGLPWLIVRPSIVIGDSRDGHYNGPRYGLYQLWSGIERFLLDEWAEEGHYVAPRRPIPLLHQDAFQSGFLAAFLGLPAGSIVHLTSRGGPDVRSIAELVVHRHIRPGRLRYYERLADVPLDEIPLAQRTFVGMAAVNIEISSRSWAFETGTLDRLIAGGLRFPDATLEGVERCQEAYFQGSERLRRYTRRFGHLFPERTPIDEFASPTAS